MFLLHHIDLHHFPCAQPRLDLHHFPWWTCTIGITNSVSVLMSHKEWCQMTPCIISMFRIHNACSTRKMIPAAHVLITCPGIPETNKPNRHLEPELPHQKTPLFYIIL